MGRFLFQLIGTLITLAIIGLIGYIAFSRLFQYIDGNEQQEVVMKDNNGSLKESIINRVNEKINEKVHSTGKSSATIKNLYVDNNIKKDGLKGMQIAVEFESQNLKDESLYCMVRFYNDDGSPLVQQNFNKKYRSVNGNVIVGEATSPTYDDCKTRTTLFIPYDELPVKTKGRTDLILDASILHYTTNTDYEVLDRSKTYSFYITND